MAVERVRTAEQARRLADHLRSRWRALPAVVVSTSATSGEPWIEVQRLENELEDSADLFLIDTGAATWALAERLPAHTEVYGGAGRAYPTGEAWCSDPHLSPLRFSFDPQTGAEATVQLVSDALRMAHHAGLVSPPQGQQTRSASGTVRWVDAERAIVVLDDRTHATVVRELTVPDVPLDAVLTLGMELTGSFDVRSHRLDIGGLLQAPEDALGDYAEGSLVLAQVEEVRTRSVRLRLFPGVEVWVRTEQVTANDLDDDLRALLTVEEVLAVHIVQRDPEWIVRLDDVDDDETPLEPPSLLPDGPPWLALPDEDVSWVELHSITAQEEANLLETPPQLAPSGSPEAEPRRPEGQPASPGPSPLLLDPHRRLQAPPPPPASPPIPSVPAPETERPAARSRLVQDLNLKIASLQAGLEETKSQLNAVRSESQMLAERLSGAHREIQALRAEGARLRTQVRKRSKSGAEEQLGGQFADPAEQLRFEIEYRWAMRIPASDKARYPLATYELVPGFAESVEALQGIGRKKIVDVIVEVLTGVAAESPGRKLRRLRVSDHGGSPDLVRSSDGALAMRVNLQTRSPSARRLHYWQRPDATIELVKVAVHDDYGM